MSATSSSYELPNRLRFLVANLHASHIPDLRLADAELRRAVNFVIRGSELEETLIVGGDFNIKPDVSHDRPGAGQRPASSRAGGRQVPGSTSSCCAARSRRASRCGPTSGARSTGGCSPTTRRSRSSSSSGRRTDRPQPAPMTTRLLGKAAPPRRAALGTAGRELGGTRAACPIKVGRHGAEAHRPFGSSEARADRVGTRDLDLPQPGWESSHRRGVGAHAAVATQGTQAGESALSRDRGRRQCRLDAGGCLS